MKLFFASLASFGVWTTAQTAAQGDRATEQQLPAQLATEGGGLFAHIPDGLSAYSNIGPIPFDPTWMGGARGRVIPPPMREDALPSHLHPPDFLTVFEYNVGGSNNTTGCSDLASEDDLEEATCAVTNNYKIVEMAKAVRGIADFCFREGNDLCTSGALLFRNMSSVVSNPSEYAIFWDTVRTSGDGRDDDWNAMETLRLNQSLKKEKDKSKIVTVTVEHTNLAVTCHSEGPNAPKPPGKIGLYMMRPATTGGESLLCRSSDLHDAIDPSLHTLIQKKGGLRYKRRFYNELKIPDVLSELDESWQEKTEAGTLEEALQWFADTGLKDDEIFVDELDQSIWFNYTITGYSNQTGKWFNQLQNYRFHTEFADGTPIPDNLWRQLKRDVWQSTTAFKLEPGDLLLLDNHRVLHGRLPYLPVNPSGEKRLLMSATTD